MKPMTRTRIAPNWMLDRQERPEMEDRAAGELLRTTAQRDGAWRLATRNGRCVEELGETWDGVTRDRQREEEQGIADVVDATLEELGLAWKRRESGRVVLASARCPLEIVLTIEENALRIESTLVSWDEIGEEEERALAEFLCRAQAGLRFARCELLEKKAVVAARPRAADVEVGLEHFVVGVLAAGRALSREAQALVVPGLAGEYLRFVEDGLPIRPTGANGSEILAGSARM